MADCQLGEGLFAIVEYQHVARGRAEPSSDELKNLEPVGTRPHLSADGDVDPAIISAGVTGSLSRRPRYHFVDLEDSGQIALPAQDVGETKGS